MLLFLRRRGSPTRLGKSSLRLLAFFSFSLPKVCACWACTVWYLPEGVLEAARRSGSAQAGARTLIPTERYMMGILKFSAAEQHSM